MTEEISWGIIGCGDVTEKKSGPAFRKVSGSKLTAVMRRDAEKAKDYAARHHVPKWYSSPKDLIHDAEVNAIYIATPPSFHEQYCIEAFRAGKPVYVEKPMSVNGASAQRMLDASRHFNKKLCVAHYRREQPLFKKVKSLLEEQAIGDVRICNLQYFKPSLTAEQVEKPQVLWRLNPAVSGGGLFHDLAPHQLDLMYFFFGEVEKASGIALNQAGGYKADDIVCGNIVFQNGIVFNGAWCFNVAESERKDWCEIVGSRGKISFKVFEHKELLVTVEGKEQTHFFDPLEHVQLPMIQKVTDYFLGKCENPSSGKAGVVSMKLMDQFTQK